MTEEPKRNKIKRRQEKLPSGLQSPPSVIHRMLKTMSENIIQQTHFKMQYHTLINTWEQLFKTATKNP